MVSTNKVVMQKMYHWKDQMSYYRFWQDDNMMESDLTDLAVEHCLKYIHPATHLLLIEDTTELNLEHQLERIKDKQGLGVTGNNKDLVFFSHPTIALNAETGALLGTLDIRLWERSESKKDKTTRKYKEQPLEEKELYRWSERAIKVKESLSPEQRITVV
jgi:hypothetical protein